MIHPSNAKMADLVAERVAHRLTDAAVEQAKDASLTDAQRAAKRLAELQAKAQAAAPAYTPTIGQEIRKSIDTRGLLASPDRQAQIEAERLAEAQEQEARRVADWKKRCRTIYDAAFPALARAMIAEGKYTLGSCLSANPVQGQIRAADLRRRLSSPTGAMIVLWGPPGTSKTVVATLIGRDCIAGKFEPAPVVGQLPIPQTVAYIKGMGFWASHTATWKPSGPTDAEWMRGLVLPRLLVIDELDAIHHTSETIAARDQEARVQHVLMRVLHERHDAMKLTVLIGNFERSESDKPDEPPASLLAVLGPKIADRMHESGAFIEMDGESKRGQSKGGR